MTVLKVTNFGGLAPSVSPRALGPELAQTNTNLYAATQEFRPLSADRDIGYATGMSNPVTIYKQSRISVGGGFATETQGWRVSSSLLNYVKGQIDDDLSERTYYSFNDGVTAPRVFDVAASPVDKPLGVTPPSTAPTVTLARGQKYTIEEDSAARSRIPAQVKAYVVAAATQTMFGAAPTPSFVAGNADGWAAHSVTLTSTGAGGNPATQVGEYSYCILMTNSSSGYVVPEAHNWALAPELGGRRVTSGVHHYWAVPVLVQAVGWTANAATLTTNFKEIVNPDPDFVRTVTTGYTGSQPSKQLFPDVNCASVATFISDTYAATADPQESHIRDIATKTAAVLAAVGDYGSTTPQKAAVKEFYSANTAVTNHLSSVINTFTDEMTGAFRAYASYYDETVSTTDQTNFRAAVVALFPATFTIAAVGANTYINFTGTNGALEINIKNLRAAVNTLANTHMGAALATAPAYYLNSAKSELMRVFDTSAGPKLDTEVSFQTISAKFPNSLPVVTPVADRLRAVVQAINALRDACETVNEDYNRHTREMITLIDRLFDEQIAPMMSKPKATSIETRAYITTWVTTWGEESAPSAPSAILEEVDDVDTVTVTKPANTVAAELQAGWRLYRTNTGSATTDYQLVIGKKTDTGAVYDGDTFLYFDKTLASYADNQPGFMLGETVPSANWLKPDSRLKGLVAMANGMMAGFYDNVVCFCEPYKPYAWPVDYQLTVKYPIVGIESAGANLFVLTRGSPYLLTGNDPATVTPVEIPSNQSCSSQRSIVAIEGGAVYASPDGLCYIGTNGVEVITLAHFSREDWQKLTPSSIIGAYHEGVYYFLYSGNGGGSYAFDLRSKKLTVPGITGSSFFVDKSTDTMYVASGTAINAIFGAAGKRTGVYKTGVITLPLQQPLAWLKVFSDFSTTVTVKWYGDGVLRHTATVSSIEPLRLPAGRYLEHEIEVTSAARVTGVYLCSTSEELKSV